MEKWFAGRIKSVINIQIEARMVLIFLEKSAIIKFIVTDVSIFLSGKHKFPNFLLAKRGGDEGRGCLGGVC